MVLTISAESILWGCFLTQLQEPGYPINLHAMVYLGEGSASVGWKQGLQLIQSGDSIFETEDLKVTEGFLQDKEIFNLVSIALVLLHFVL